MLFSDLIYGFWFCFSHTTTKTSKNFKKEFMLTAEKLADQTCQLTVANDKQTSIYPK